jgi:hypothetical protein
MSEWAMYIKNHYDSVRHLPVRERFAALAKMRKGEVVVRKTVRKTIKRY